MNHNTEQLETVPAAPEASRIDFAEKLRDERLSRLDAARPQQTVGQRLFDDPQTPQLMPPISYRIRLFVEHECVLDGEEDCSALVRRVRKAFRRNHWPAGITKQRLLFGLRRLYPRRIRVRMRDKRIIGIHLKPSAPNWFWPNVPHH
jgi:hypothetical protein